MNNPKQSESITWRKLKDKVIVIDLDNKRMFHQMNRVAAFIWSQCNGENSIETIEEMICNRFDVDQNTAKEDVARFLEDLWAKELIVQ